MAMLPPADVRDLGGGAWELHAADDRLRRRPALVSAGCGERARCRGRADLAGRGARDALTRLHAAARTRRRPVVPHPGPVLRINGPPDPDLHYPRFAKGAWDAATMTAERWAFRADRRGHPGRPRIRRAAQRGPGDRRDHAAGPVGGVVRGGRCVHGHRLVRAVPRATMGVRRGPGGASRWADVPALGPPGSGSRSCVGCTSPVRSGGRSSRSCGTCTRGSGPGTRRRRWTSRISRRPRPSQPKGYRAGIVRPTGRSCSRPPRSSAAPARRRPVRFPTIGGRCTSPG